MRAAKFPLRTHSRQGVADHLDQKGRSLTPTTSRAKPHAATHLFLPCTHALMTRQTASVAGHFDVLSKQELRDHGMFAAVLSKNFDFPIFGGWTLELSFNKPVFE